MPRDPRSGRGSTCWPWNTMSTISRTTAHTSTLPWVRPQLEGEGAPAAAAAVGLPPTPRPATVVTTCSG
ncbi:unnamed protein product [Ectocarpus sp. 13 AM-2016]